MCDPVAIAVASIGSTLAGTDLGIARQARQAAAQQAMYGYQAQVARNDQIAAERLAQDAEQRGKVEEDARRRRAAQIAGARLAMLAGQGTDLAGSPADILGDVAAAGEQDALASRADAAREAWRHRMRGTTAADEAALSQFRQRSSALSPLDVGAPLISGAGSVAEKWYRYDR